MWPEPCTRRVTSSPTSTKPRITEKLGTQITDGIPSEHFTRVLRADPAKKGLLYAGTETGMYISHDDGASWNPFQLNLPIVPITDLTLKDNSLDCGYSRAQYMDLR